MSDEYVNGEIIVAFKPEADYSKIEEILHQFPHEKVFSDSPYDKQIPREDQVLARLYSLKCKNGSEEVFLANLNESYKDIVEYAHLPTVKKKID